MFGALARIITRVVSGLTGFVNRSMKDDLRESTYTYTQYMYDINGEACHLCAPKDGSRLTVYDDGSTEQTGVATPSYLEGGMIPRTGDGNFSMPPVHPNCDCIVRVLAS